MSAFWVVSALLLVFFGHYAFHKIRQLKLKVKKLEFELFLTHEFYGKERQEERLKAAETEKTKEPGS